MRKSSPTNPFENRDLTKRLLFPVLSWSSYNAFVNYDKEKWYRQYVLGEKQRGDHMIKAGRDIGERIANDPEFLPEIPRGGIFEQEFEAELLGIKLRGHLDQWWPDVPRIDEYKTSIYADRWTQEKVDAHEQLDFYCLLAQMCAKKKVEDLHLRLFFVELRESGKFEAVPTGKVKMFHTKRTTARVLKFGAKLKAIHRQMTEFVDAHQDVR